MHVRTHQSNIISVFTVPLTCSDPLLSGKLQPRPFQSLNPGTTIWISNQTTEKKKN